MGSVDRSPPASDAATLSSLTKGPFEKETTITVTQKPSQVRPQDLKNLDDGWVLARRSRIPSWAWNRQSILVFADFNNFENPPGRNADEIRDTKSGVEISSSSASSLYNSEKVLPEASYHVFTLAKKKQLVYIVSLAGLFSPLSSNIYFPALGQIAIVCLIIYSKSANH